MAEASSSSTTRDNVPLILDSDEEDFSEERQRKVLDKLTCRVVLLCVGIAFVAYVDRCNVGYAANDLCSDLHLSHSEYGTAVSLFYIGYIVSQPTCNVMLRRFGAPVWLAFIVCTWGFVATLSAFIQSLWQFYVIRVLLGLAEGGTFPGIFYHLGLFFPDAYIEEAYASVQASLSFSMLLSSPIAAGLLGSDGLYGTRGWRNLFFVEGLIPIAYSIMLFFLLPKSLETASFLDSDEKEWLIKHQKDRTASTTYNLLNEIWEIFRSVRFWLLTFCWGMAVGVFVVLLYWISLIIQEGLNGDKDDDKETCGSGGSSVVAVALTTIPFALNGCLCISIRTKTRHVRNRTAFAALIFTVCSVFMLSWVWTREYSFVFGFISLTMAITPWSCGLTFVIGVISTLFRPELRSTVVALANGLGSLGSFVLPIIIGYIVDNYGYHYAIPFGAITVLVAAFSIFIVKDPLLIVDHKIEPF